ncbi:PTS transporter subunit IIC [Pontibacillus litoralis]|uniref:Membrane protein n=1 Tax=Pontibacillus litoralis JSM 072002 TaxID=1385512 RepID=A0A0A5G9G0_9BACI|nr:PTS sugar transporter subunit IIC [Pontibacillus litoralis]KGX87750.1 membrane protein [Pontibacillus litoralis JSM 072002]
METEKLTAKKFTMNVLNGLAIGTVIALIPGALLGELFKALLGVFPQGQVILNATSMATSVLGLVVGVIIGYQFKFTPIQSASIGLAVLFGGGAVNFSEGAMTLSGTGDVINMGITGAIAAGLVLLLGNRLKAYSILLIPTIILVVAGGLGVFLLPYVAHITTLIGMFVAQLLNFQPIIMSILIAITFSLLIVSPITTVGIAVAISLTGLGAGAGNLGICAAGFGLAIAGWKVNPIGTNLAHFIGSPKMSMPNFFAKPKIMIPIICNAACVGILAAVFNIQGTPMSAGFGFSGLVGPINHINLVEGGWTIMNVMVTTGVFVIAPVVFGIIFNHLFTKVWPIISPEDYKLDIE